MPDGSLGKKMRYCVRNCVKTAITEALQTFVIYTQRVHEHLNVCDTIVALMQNVFYTLIGNENLLSS